MSRAPTASASRWAHRTLGALAAALGVSRNTPAAWLREGAPGGPPFDEQAWRSWAAGKGKRVPGSPPVELLAELVRAGVRGYELAGPATAPAAADAGAGLGAPLKPPPAPGGASLEETQRHNKALREYLDLQERYEERQVASRQLVHVHQLAGLVDALAALAASVFDGLPAIADEYSTAADDQARLRRLIQARADAARTALRQGARARLRTFLEAQESEAR